VIGMESERWSVMIVGMRTRNVRNIFKLSRSVRINDKCQRLIVLC
jgi:hypothetical protein